MSYEDVDEDDARKYVGARGLGVKYLLDNGVGIAPLAPVSLLGVMIGTVVGTRTGMNGRLAVVPLAPDRRVRRLPHGRHDRRATEWAGLDGLLFTGNSAKPVNAYVEDGHVTLIDATQLWGKGVFETVKWLKSEHGDESE